MINKLKEICNKLITINKDDEKYQIIKKILNKEDSFLNMDIEYAYSILRDLNIPEESLKEVYFELIDPNNNKTEGDEI